MSNNIEVKLNREAIRDVLLKGDDTARLIEEYANNAYSTLSAEGYEIEKRTYPERIGYAIYAKDYPAISDNLQNNSLLKAVKKG